MNKEKLPDRLGAEAIAHSRFIDGWNSCLDAIVANSPAPIFTKDAELTENSE